MPLFWLLLITSVIRVESAVSAELLTANIETGAAAAAAAGIAEMVL